MDGNECACLLGHWRGDGRSDSTFACGSVVVSTGRLTEGRCRRNTRVRALLTRALEPPLCTTTRPPLGDGVWAVWSDVAILADCAICHPRVLALAVARWSKMASMRESGTTHPASSNRPIICARRLVGGASSAGMGIRTWRALWGLSTNFFTNRSKAVWRFDSPLYRFYGIYRMPSTLCQSCCHSCVLHVVYSSPDSPLSAVAFLRPRRDLASDLVENRSFRVAETSR